MGKKPALGSGDGVRATAAAPAAAGRGDWARLGPPEAIRCLSILLVRHLWDAVVVPAQERRGGEAMDAEERLDLIAAAIIAAESLMQKNLPLTLKALARHYGAGPG